MPLTTLSIECIYHHISGKMVEKKSSYHNNIHRVKKILKTLYSKLYMAYSLFTERGVFNIEQIFFLYRTNIYYTEQGLSSNYF